MQKDYILLLAVLYTVPIVRLALFFIPPIDSAVLRSLNSLIGHIEWFLKPFRDRVLLVAIIIFSLVNVYTGRFMPAMLLFPFMVLSAYSLIRYQLHLRRMAELARQNPFMDPVLFFKCYYSGLGMLPVSIAKKNIKIVNPLSANFKNRGPSRKCFWPVLVGAINTATLARIVVTAHRWKGPQYARDVSSKMISIWGARAVFLTQATLKLEGIENISALDGKFVFAFSHKSFLDFALAPYLLSKTHPSIRFLAAKDHFLDNPLLYFILGRALRLIGTIFVERKGKNARAASGEAVDKLVNAEGDICIFPQGTRSFGNVDEKGARLDSGYYTSGDKNRLKKMDGHLKKGAVHIAVDTILELKKREKSQVNLIPVALINTGLVVPKKALTIQTNADIVVKIGLPIVLTGGDVQKIEIGSTEYRNFVEDIQRRLDLNLKEALGIHNILEKRFFKDIRGLIPSSDYEQTSLAMRVWRAKDYLIYVLLDCIYATRPKNWQALLRELCYLMIQDAPVATFMRFKERAVDAMINKT